MSSDDRKVEATNNKKIAFSLDYDNCSGILSKQYRKSLKKSKGSKVLSAVRKKYAKELTALSQDASQVYLFLGSNRQNDDLEKGNQSDSCQIIYVDENRNPTGELGFIEGSGRAKDLPNNLAQKKNWMLKDSSAEQQKKQEWFNISSRMIDFDFENGKQKSAESTENPPTEKLDEKSTESAENAPRAKEEKKNTKNTGSKTPKIKGPWSLLLSENQGMAKACFLSLQLKAFGEKLNTGEEAHFYFIDDRSDILDTVHDYFQNNPTKIPEGITLHISRFNMEDAYDNQDDLPILWGTSIPNPASDLEVIDERYTLTCRPNTLSARACLFFNQNPATTKVYLMPLRAAVITTSCVFTVIYLLKLCSHTRNMDAFWKKDLATTPKGLIGFGVIMSLLLLTLVVYYILYRKNPDLFLPRKKEFAELFEDGLKFPEPTPTQSKS